jgi:hypothetical protein
MLKDWITKRINWIGNTIPNIGACYDYPGSVKESVIISLYPNPVEEQLTLNIKSRYNQKLQVNVFDAMGREMASNSFSLNIGENIFQLQAVKWSPGVYILSFESGNKEKGTVKLLKK